jgi:hypothetical protein
MSQARVEALWGHAVQLAVVCRSRDLGVLPASPRRIWIVLSILILVMLLGTAALYLKGL